MGFLKRLLGKKEKEVEKPSFSGPRFPSPGKEKEWMSSKLDHYKKHNPEHAHHLFSPASGDYLPTAVHVGSTAWHRNHEAQKHYGELKKQNPDLVKRAKEHTLNWGHLGMSRVGDYEDTHGVTVREDVMAEACWDGYKQLGLKNKKGKQVPNCVPVKEEAISEESKTWRVVGDHGPQAGDNIEKHIVAKTKEAATASFAKHVEKHYPLQWKRMGHHNIQAHEIKEESKAHEKAEMKILNNLEKKTDKLIKKDAAVHKKLGESQEDYSNRLWEYFYSNIKKK